jgi:hypothetical protein
MIGKAAWLMGRKFRECSRCGQKAITFGYDEESAYFVVETPEAAVEALAFPAQTCGENRRCRRGIRTVLCRRLGGQI